MDKCGDAITTRFVKKDITYECIHGGIARDNKVDNCRKNPSYLPNLPNQRHLTKS